MTTMTTMTTCRAVDIAVELLCDEGPTGVFQEVTEVAIRDYGGNEYWRGPAADYVAGKAPEFRIPTRLVATETTGVNYQGKGHELYPVVVADFVDDRTD